jgi:hypothetical protein
VSVLRADAVFDAAMGLLLLAATWDGLYEALGLPVARPALYAQLAGGLLLAYAYLLWLGDDRRRLAAVTATVNALAVLVLAIWLLSGELGAETLGEVILWLAAAVLALFALLEFRLARERDA